MGTAGAAIISAGAIVSISGNLNILVLSGSRLPFAFAEQKALPAFVARVHPRFFTPHVAIMITASAMLVFTLKTSFVAALTISAIARLVTYGVTCAALPVLRRRSGVSPAMFRVRGGTVIAVAALVLAICLLSHRTRTVGIQATIAAAVGLLIYLVYRVVRYNARRPEKSNDPT